MEQLPGGLTMDIPEGCFPLSTDSVALAGFVRLRTGASVLDLGSGCATLGLILCATDSKCSVTGIEVDERAHAAALENIRRNDLSTRLFSICADIRTIPSRIHAGSFCCCVSNPPYFSGGPASSAYQTARREDLCSLDDLIKSAAWALQYGGDFYLVHRPERLAEIFTKCAASAMEPKRLCLVRHKATGPVSLVLIHCKKGAKPGLKWEEWALYDAQGNPTQQYRTLYHLQEA